MSERRGHARDRGLVVDRVRYDIALGDSGSTRNTGPKP